MRRLLILALVLFGSTSVVQASSITRRSGGGEVLTLTKQTLQSIHQQKNVVPQSDFTAFAHLRKGLGLTDKPSFASKTRQLIATADAAPTTANDLALSATLLSSNNGTQAPVNSGQGPFSAFHQSYAGFQSGIAATFNGAPVATGFYQGSVFSDPASAQAYMTQSATLTASYTTTPPSDCSKDTSVPCKLVAFTSTSGQLVLYGVGQVNYCVIEAGAQGDPTLIQENLLTVSNLVGGLLVLGIQEAKAACTGPDPNHPQPKPVAPVQLNLVKVQFEKATLLPSPTNPRLAKMKHGSLVHLSAYFTVSSGPPSVTVTATFKLRRAGKVVLHGKATGFVSPATEPSWDFFTLKLNKKGKYKGTVTTVAGDKSVTGSASITVK